jgi:hypothetical protein
MLLVVVRDRDNDFVEKLSSPIDHVEVAVGDRVETARINGATGHGTESRMTNGECRMSRA